MLDITLVCTYLYREKCCHLEYARNGAEKKAMEKQIILPTQAFLEDIDSSDEELPEEHALDSRPHR